MADSILDDVRHILNVDSEYTVFDRDLILHINSVFSTLQQLGIGPEDGYMIEDATAEWNEFMGVDARLNAVKTYVYLRVRLLFDPPATSFAITALENQAKELEWRLEVAANTTVEIVDTP